MKSTDFQEDFSSQIPAIRLLVNAGYTYLSKEKTAELRYDKTSNVLLEPVLKEQLAKINEIKVSSSQTEKFTQSNIDEAVLRLKEIPFESGYTAAHQYIYEMLTLGTTLDQTIEGNKREYTLKYIDWKNPKNNVFHVAEEFSVQTTDGRKELRPDIVLFVNGIPLAVIENKREDLEDPIGQAISQHTRNQQEDNIRKLYVYAQIMMACAVGEAKYGTNGTPANFWSTWKEKEIEESLIQEIKNKPVSDDVIKNMIARRASSVYFSNETAEKIYDLLTNPYLLTEQDKMLFALAYLERLLDLIHNFILYDSGIKKITRYQQYFAIKNTMKRIITFSPPSPALPPEGEGSGVESEKTISYRGNLYFSGLLKRARELRQKQTPAEEIFWQLLRNRKLNNLKFRRQHQIGHYIVDFYCHEKRLIVELDGKIHDNPEQIKHDLKRDKQLKSMQFHILRFQNERIFNDLENVLLEIADFNPKSDKENKNLPSPTGRGTEGEGTPSRRGGVIWHTQGSGKSLTMGFLAEAIAREETIKNPKIILVTDRTDLDKQITGTFKNIGLEVLNAKTGKHLIKILNSNTDAVITTIINKFETAVRKIKTPIEDPNIFVLVDEGHRTQHGTFNINMQLTLPNACYIALTGTPLFKKDKNTLAKFGSMIDQYTVRQAVQDGAVLPLLYEGRFSDMEVNKDPIDTYFDKVSEPLTSMERADLKKKFSSANMISDADKNIYAFAWDISEHYVKNFKSTGLKGQLVCSNKAKAVKYLHYLKEIGKVSCALVISPPDDREGEETAYGETSDSVKKFWKEMMDQYGNERNYEENIIRQFKHDDQPEIIIVVDKLLTGFDAPKNTVLYLTRKLRGHTLLQAIARVNRLYPGKEYGYIIDYAGVVGELDSALMTYSDLEDFDEDDLAGTLVNIQEEIKKLDVKHQQLLNVFKSIKNKDDLEEYQQLLRPKDIRDDFYKYLREYASILKVALSSITFHKNTDPKKIVTYKNDLKFFMNLRTSVAKRYSDKVDFKHYEKQIEKLLDQHISSKGVEKLTEMVNIFDEDAFQEEVEKTIGTAAKADKIASRTAKHISEKMGEDPAFYKKFSQLIQQAIDDFYAQRISEAEYLRRVNEYRDKVLTKTDSDIPEGIRHNPSASAYYGIMHTFYDEKDKEIEINKDILESAAVKIEEIINSKKQVSWKTNPDIIKKMILEIGDYIYDEVGEKMGIKIDFSDLDGIAEQMVNVAKTRE